MTSKKLSLLTLDRLLETKRERLKTKMLSELELDYLKEETRRSLEVMDAILDGQDSVVHPEESSHE